MLTLRRHRMQRVNMAFVMACGWLKYCPIRNYFFFIFFAFLFSTIKAKKLCQDLISVPYDFEAYEEASRALYRCLLKHRFNFIFSLKVFFRLIFVFFFSSTIEAKSCDEAVCRIVANDQIVYFMN